MELNHLDYKEKNIKLEECILSIAVGNIDAMDEIFSIIKDDVYAFAVSKIKNKTDAEDILQDTFIQIYKNAKLYTPLGKPMAWIFMIEANLINRYFQLKNRVVNLDDELLEQIQHYESKEEKLIKNELIDSVLNKLAIEEREIIILHIVSGMKFKDIASIVAMPLSTVLSKYNRAMKKIKKGGSK